MDGEAYWVVGIPGVHEFIPHTFPESQAGARPCHEVRQRAKVGLLCWCGVKAHKQAVGMHSKGN